MTPGEDRKPLAPRLLGFVKLLGPGDMAVAFAAAALSARLAAGWDVARAAACAFGLAAVVAGANVNDAWLHRDAYLRAWPFNPLAQRHVGATEARWLALVLAGVGLGLTVTAGIRASSAAFVLAAVLLAFNYFFFGAFLGHNFRAVVAAAGPMVYGWFGLGGTWRPLVVPALATGALAFAATAFADVGAREGAAAGGLRVLGATRGRAALAWAGGLAAAGAAAWGMPWGRPRGSTFYLTAVGTATAITLVYAVLNLRRREADIVLAASTAHLVKFILFLLMVAAYGETYPWSNGVVR
jgi:4-hydroxybenzoate polyprenyltransferase